MLLSGKTPEKVLEKKNVIEPKPAKCAYCESSGVIDKGDDKEFLTVHRDCLRQLRNQALMSLDALIEVQNFVSSKRAFINNYYQPFIKKEVKQ